jgi:hypothetical protein
MNIQCKPGYGIAAAFETALLSPTRRNVLIGLAHARRFRRDIHLSEYGSAGPRDAANQRSCAAVADSWIGRRVGPSLFHSENVQAGSA